MSTPIKILVKDKEHSKHIQTLLFEMECGWNVDASGRIHQNIEGRYLFVDKHKVLTYMPDDSMGLSCFKEKGREELFTAHIKQLDFLRKIFFKGARSEKRFIVNKILQSGFYYRKDRKFLNELL